jgi:hypothetical protein
VVDVGCVAEMKKKNGRVKNQKKCEEGEKKKVDTIQ